MFGRDKKKSAAPQPDAPVVIVGGRLRELCGPDEEMYTTLSRLLLLDPPKIASPLETLLSEAQGYETKGNRIKAEVGYRVAGGLSLWKGDTDGVRNYFNKASVLAGGEKPEYLAIMKKPDIAVAIARRFYEVPETEQKP